MYEINLEDSLFDKKTKPPRFSILQGNLMGIREREVIVSKCLDNTLTAYLRSQHQTSSARKSG